jgi:hypothetical protein
VVVQAGRAPAEKAAGGRGGEGFPRIHSGTFSPLRETKIPAPALHAYERRDPHHRQVLGAEIGHRNTVCREPDPEGWGDVCLLNKETTAVFTLSDKISNYLAYFTLEVRADTLSSMC